MVTRHPIVGVTFIEGSRMVGGERIPTHKIILYTSNYFGNALTEHWSSPWMDGVVGWPDVLAIAAARASIITDKPFWS